jgi:hypothetical protein
MRALTTDMTRRDLRPYFLWDEDVSIGELQQILAGPHGPRRDQLLGKMLREARDLDVWQFVRPIEVAGALERLRRRLGRRYAFWSFLIEGWRRHGLLGTWQADASAPPGMPQCGAADRCVTPPRR